MHLYSSKAHLQAKHMEGSWDGGVVTAVLLQTLYGISAAHTIHDAMRGFV
jgi:hypothetical protein